MANNKIQVKRTNVSGRTPNTTSSGNSQYIDAGELALNMADGILYTSNGSSSIELGANNTKQNISTNNLTVGNTLYIVANGNIGIGTSSPNTTLEINGSARLANNGYLNWLNYNSTTTGPYIRGYSDSLSIDAGPNGPGRGALTLTGHNNTRLQTDGGFVLIQSTLVGFSGAYVAFNTGASERMRITNDGNVGIGTSSPISRLHVYGSTEAQQQIRIDGTSIVSSLKLHYNGTEIGFFKNYSNAEINFGSTANVPVLFYSNNTERMRLSAVGYFGIGVSSPSEKLHLRTASGGRVVIRFDDGVATRNNFVGVDNYEQLVLAADEGAVSGATPAIKFRTANSERMRIAANGNVGIGTTTPGAKLEVSGSSNSDFAAAIFRNSNTGSAAITSIRLGNDVTSSGAYIGLNGNANASNPNSLRISNLITGTSSQIIFATNSDTERMRIDANGNLGLNRTPTTWSATTRAIQFAQGAALVGGYIGADPIVTIAQNAYFDSNWKYDTTGYAATRYEQKVGSHQWFTAPSGTASANITFTQAMTLTANGNLGVGTANPSKKLHVEGDAIFTGNLTISGNVTVIGANNLSIVDNFIYLNSNNSTQNIDLGFAGNYNDGTYRHTGFFRDATDGYYKVFDNYEPEPDANVNIDTANSTFRIANFWSDTNRLGNTSLYATINSSSYSLDSTSYKHSGGNLVLVSGSTDRVIVAANGNVGIGNSTPTARLDLGVYGGGTSLRVQDGWTDVVTAGYVVGTRYIYGVTTHGRLYSNFYGMNIDTGSTSVPIIIGTNGSERMRIAANGNIGIGTTSPSDLLVVESQTANVVARIGAGVTASYSATLAMGTTTRDWALVAGNAAASYSLRLNYIGTDAPVSNIFTALKGGNVGIGTSSPLGRLHVLNDADISMSGSANGQLIVTGNAYSGAIALDATGMHIYHNSASRSLIFGTNETERMRIAANGNVGIGTTAPAYKLTVATGISYLQYGVQMDSGYKVNFGNPNQWIRGTNDTSIEIGTAGSTSFIVTNDKRVGIGTTNPAYDLDVDGSIGLTADATNKYYITNDGSFKIALAGIGSLVTVNSSGNVGINTTTPAAKLHVSDATNPSIRVTDTTNPTSVELQAIDGIGYLGTQTNHPLGFFTNGNQKVRITTSGDFGIGTTNPVGKLQISGGTVTPAKFVWQRYDGAINAKNWISYVDASHDLVFGKADDSGNQTNDYLHIQSDGNIGISNTAPTHKLSVNGNTYLQGDLTVTGNTNIAGNLTSNSTISANSLIASNGSITLNNVLEIDTNRNQVTTNTQIVATSFSMLTYRGAKFIIAGRSGNETHLSEILLTHNFSNTFHNEYGSVYSNGSLYTVTSDISSDNVRLLIVPTYPDFSFELIEQKFIENYVGAGTLLGSETSAFALDFTDNTTAQRN